MSALENLLARITEAKWFSNLGSCTPIPGIRVVSGDAWRSVVALGDLDSVVSVWLPTARDEMDPIRGEELAQIEAEIGGSLARDARRAAAAEALSSLRRSQPARLLLVGPHDLNGAARGAALFATRRAATECALGNPGFWSDLMPFYFAGNWPLGLTASRELVVL